MHIPEETFPKDFAALTGEKKALQSIDSVRLDTNANAFFNFWFENNFKSIFFQHLTTVFYYVMVYFIKRHNILLCSFKVYLSGMHST